MGITDLLNSTGAKSFPFPVIGASVTGTVLSAEIVQKRNFDTMELEVWDDGKPVPQVRIIVETTLREPVEPGEDPDDGHRSVYIKGWGNALKALRAAIKAAGAKDLLPGGTFTATYDGDIPLPPGKRGFPTKHYSYSYTAPSSTAGMLATPPAAHAGPAVVATPTPAPSWAAQEAAHATSHAPTPAPSPAAAPAAAAAVAPAMSDEMAAKFAAWQANQSAGA